MKFKVLISTALSAVMLCSFRSVCTTAVAAEPYSIAAPLYEKDLNGFSGLGISGSAAECTSRCRSDNAVKITAEQYLQKQGFLWIWGTYDGTKWTKTSYSNTLSMSNTKSGLSSGKYRLKTVFTITDSSGKTETTTVYSQTENVG